MLIKTEQEKMMARWLIELACKRIVSLSNLMAEETTDEETYRAAGERCIIVLTTLIELKNALGEDTTEDSKRLILLKELVYLPYDEQLN